MPRRKVPQRSAPCPCARCSRRNAACCASSAPQPRSRASCRCARGSPSRRGKTPCQSSPTRRCTGSGKPARKTRVRQSQRRLRRPKRSEEHTSELQSHLNLVCRLLLEKKKQNHDILRQHKRHCRGPKAKTTQEKTSHRARVGDYKTKQHKDVSIYCQSMRETSEERCA